MKKLICDFVGTNKEFKKYLEDLIDSPKFIECKINFKKLMFSNMSITSILMDHGFDMNKQICRHEDLENGCFIFRQEKVD